MIYVLGGKFQAAITAAKLLKTMGVDLYICPSSGENKIDAMPSLYHYAERNQLKVVRDLKEFSGRRVFFLSVEFDKIIDTQLFEENSVFYNVHFSLLPLFRGTMSSFWPIVFRQQETGVTLHKIEKGIDTGEILFQKKFVIPDDYTCRDLYFRYHEVASALLEENIHDLVDQNFVSKPQDNSSATSFPRFLYQFVPKEFTSKQLRLMETIDVYNLIRSLIFPEYQFPVVDGKRISKISKSFFEQSTMVIQTNGDVLYAAEYTEEKEGRNDTIS